MSKQPKTESIPLLCSLCPKNPKFSDISHLLTHISSKGHLSHRFKLQIRCQADPEAKRQLDIFDKWYVENGLDGLLAQRLASKDQKNGLKRTRTLPKARAQEKIGKGKGKIKNREEDFELEGRIDDRLFSTPIYKAPVPRMHLWSTALPLPDTPFNSVPSTRWEQQDAYATPTMRRRSVPNFTYLENPEANIPTHMSISPVKPNGLNSVTNDSSKLKGVLWPGMSLFDSATAEMKRMRNQKKDGSILAQMKTTSSEVEPNEIIYNAEGEFQRIKDIYASSTDNSPVKSEKSPSAKKRRTRKVKAPLGNVNINIPAVQNSNKCGRRRRPATKPKAEVAPIDITPEPRTSNQNKLNGLGNNPFSVVTNDEDEEFRLTVANMSRKHQMSIFKDSEVDSPGRTESPLEDHRFEFNHGLPMNPFGNAASNKMMQGSPKPIQRPIPVRFDGKENLQPYYLDRRPATAGGGYPPQVFHNHATNPLMHHSYAYTFGLNDSPGFDGDFKSAQSNFGSDFRPFMMSTPFKDASGARGHQNEFGNNGFSFGM